MTTEDIDKQIAELEKAKGNLLLKKLRSPESFTLEEKGRFFDHLWEQAHQYVLYVKKHRFEEKGVERYFFEDIINKCLGPSAWGVIRSFSNG